MRVRICLAYDGTDFFGWQKQSGKTPTIQGVLEETLSKIYNQPIAVVGSGRTDRGVHAFKQWAHFDLPEDRNHQNLTYKLQRMTHRSISLRSMESAPKEFHARASAVSKCYSYRIEVSKKPNPFLRRWSWSVHKPLSFDYLQSASEFLLGTHDFESFRSRGTEVHRTLRKIFISRWVQRKSGLFEYQIMGNGFLKQMIRNIVGTLVSHYNQNKPPSAILEVLNRRDRTKAGPPAPPQGLFLTSVQYPGELDKQCRKL